MEGGSFVRRIRARRCSGKEHLASSILAKWPISWFTAREGLELLGMVRSMAALNSL